MIQELFLMRLRNHGAQIDIARSGEETLGKWQPRLFDVILMDLQMPGIDGLETTRRIRVRETADDENVYIIGVTAHARRKIREECLLEGVDEVPTKPIQIAAFGETIRNCLTR